MRSRRASTAAVAAALLGAALLGAPACNGGGRFPTCKSDAECKDRSTGRSAPICFELRCVACRSDTDCAAGEACNAANECKRFSATQPAGGDAGAEPIEKESWEPSTPADHDRCVAACKGKGKSCLERCGKAR